MIGSKVPSLLCRIYLHFRRSNGKSYMVMGNWLPNMKKTFDPETQEYETNCDWEAIYDLKGCRDDKTMVEHGERIKEVHMRCWDCPMMCGCTGGKDRERYYKGKCDAFDKQFPVSNIQHRAIMLMMQRDTNLLRDLGLMDYSLIMGVMKVGAYSSVEAVCPPGMDGDDLQPFISQEKKPGGGGASYAYYFGIIDFLQEWSGGKQCAHIIKDACAPHPIATIPPDEYADQFFDNFQDKFTATALPVEIEVTSLTPGDDGTAHHSQSYNLSQGADEDVPHAELTQMMAQANLNGCDGGGAPADSLPVSPLKRKSLERPVLLRNQNSYQQVGSVRFRFLAACDFSEHWKRGQNEVTLKEKVKAYAYLKQSTVGNIPVEQGGLLDEALGMDKWEAWDKLRGTEQQDAMKGYADTIETQRVKYEGQGAIGGETSETRFQNALEFVSGWQNDHKATLEEKLAAFKYRQQAIEGDCNVEAHEWVDEPMATDKIAAWKEVLGMHKEQAMVLYVDMIERQRALYGDKA